jgi:N-acetylmuramoyl-L-alanine amidase
MILFLIIVLEAFIMIGLVEYRSYLTKAAEQATATEQTSTLVSQEQTTQELQEELTTLADIPERDKNAADNAYQKDGQRIVCLDPALGGYAKGNSSETESAMNESEYNLEFAKLIKEELNKQNVLVYMTREESKNLDDEERTDLANNVYADLMVTLSRDSYDGKDSTSGITAWVHHKRPTISNAAAEEILDALEEAGAEVNEVDAGTAESVSSDYPTNENCIGPSLVLGMGSVLNEDDITDYEENKERYAKAVADAIVAWMDDQGL